MVDKVNGIVDTANEEKKVEYRDCYVAFLDILGFKELIKTSECSDIYDLMNECMNNRDFRIDDVADTSEITTDYLNSVFGEITLNLISDSVVISVPSDKKCSLDVLLFVICSLVIGCFRKYGVLFRGGISKGAFFASKNKVFGPALNDAYLLESQNAKFPRIIFTAELLNDYLQSNYSKGFNVLSTAVALDQTDYFQYVDFLFFLIWQGKSNTKTKEQQNELKKIILNFDKKISDELMSEKNSGIREKYVWLKEYQEKVKQRVLKEQSKQSVSSHNGVTL